MLDIKVGEKLLLIKKKHCFDNKVLEKGDILEFDSIQKTTLFDREERIRLVGFCQGVEYITVFSEEYFYKYFTKFSEDPVEFEISLEEVQAAYNSVIMTESGYMPKNVIDQFEGPWMQEGKSVSEKETDALIGALEGMNEENYKESAINVALDDRDEQKFMELTGDM